MKWTKALFSVFLIIQLFSSCHSGEDEALVHPDHSDSLMALAKSHLQNKNGWIMISQPGICWRCSGYYHFLGKEIQQCGNTTLLLITYPMRKATKEEMYTGLTWKFGELIQHREDAQVYSAFKRYLPNKYQLIYYHNDSVEVYPIDDRDKMDETWPKIKAKIQSCSP